VSETNFKILGLAASLRRASIHRGLLRAAHEVCPQGMACESFDLGRIPHFNADIEAEGDPEPVRELKEKIRAYDAVLIATPEYDYAVPGVLTTALDWCLRSPSPFRHKPVGIAGASPSGAGTARGQMVLRQILLHGPAYVMPEPHMMIRAPTSASTRMATSPTKRRARGSGGSSKHSTSGPRGSPVPGSSRKRPYDDGHDK
jgi:chromate reductase